MLSLQFFAYICILERTNFNFIPFIRFFLPERFFAAYVVTIKQVT